MVYTSIVGVVMLMACLEWFLWLAAFMYCLFKVFRKAEHWSIRILCILVGIAFALLRYVQSLCSRPHQGLTNGPEALYSYP